MEHAINPFRARTSRQRDENFPPFEEAFARTGSTTRTQEHHEPRDSRSSSAALLNQSGCSSSDANLSISARAALNEHNRHVARYGLDDEEDGDDTQQSARASAGQPRNDKAEGEDTSTPPAPAPENALDAEWDRLNSSHPMINVSHAPSSISTNDDSIHSSPDGRYCDRVLASHSLSGEEAIEVMTDLLSVSGVSDYFNTSRALEQLRTPESVRNAPESTRNQVTDRRSRYDHVFPDSRGGPSSSVASTSLNESCLNEEEQHMRHLFRIAGLPPPPQDFLSETSGIDSRNGSFSLNQVDLSHISADSETGNVDLSFQNQSLLSGGDPLIAIDEIHPSDTSYTSEQQQLRVRNKVLPYMSVSSSRSPRRRPTSNQNNSSSSSSSSHHHQRKLPPKSPLRMRHSPAASPSPWTTPPRPRTATRDSSQSAFSPSAFAASSVSSTGAAAAEEAAAAAAEAALSPLSKLAADRASQIMRSDDWKATKGTAAEPFPNLFSYNSLHNSTGSSRDEVTSVVVEYDGQYDISNDEAISPLHSSSSEQKQQRNSSSGTISSHTPKSDLKDKSSSLSSISPNSSSNLRRGTYQNLSPSSSSPNPRADPRERPLSSFPDNAEFASSQDNNSATKQRASSPPSPFGSSNHSRNEQSSVLSFGPDDRRWYRTVVPSRVFVAEPCDFPDDNDSFSVPSPMPTAWSPRRVFPWRDEHGFPVDREYYGDPLEYGGESSSAPAKQQTNGVPVVSPTEILGGRSVKSSPR